MEREKLEQWLNQMTDCWKSRAFMENIILIGGLYDDGVFLIGISRVIKALNIKDFTVRNYTEIDTDMFPYKAYFLWNGVQCSGLLKESEYEELMKEVRV